MHSMQAGYLEKAQKYTDKALMQLEKLKSESLDLFLSLSKKEKNEKEVLNHEWLRKMELCFLNWKKKTTNNKKPLFF